MLTAQTVTGYTFNYWDVDGTSQGNGVNPVTVNMNAPHTATAHYTAIAPQLTVVITPLSATVYVGQSVILTSTVSGGTAPYSYQWYLDGNPVSGATASTWTFTGSGVGVYYVYLVVTDSTNSTAQSETARIVVLQIPPVGGYTVSLAKGGSTLQVAVYAMIVAMFVAALNLLKRKRK